MEEPLADGAISGTLFVLCFVVVYLVNLKDTIIVEVYAISCLHHIEIRFSLSLT